MKILIVLACLACTSQLLFQVVLLSEGLYLYGHQLEACKYYVALSLLANIALLTVHIFGLSCAIIHVSDGLINMCMLYACNYDNVCSGREVCFTHINTN